MLSSDRKRLGPAYYGLQMIHIAAHSPGDSFISAMSSNPTLAVHATRRRDGIIGVILVNEDLAPVSAQVAVGEARVASTATRFDYGPAQAASGTPLSASEMTGLGKDFSITIPGYTISVLLISQAK